MLRRWLIALVAVLALSVNVGCSAAPEPEAESLAIVLAPEPALMDVTVDWAERWPAASGVAITIADDGAPVLSADDLFVLDDPDGDTLYMSNPQNGARSVCGATIHSASGATRAVYVDKTPPAGCAGWGYSLGHEIGHVVSGPGLEHDGALMGETLANGTQYAIDSASLEAVCVTRGGCPVFAPERL